MKVLERTIENRAVRWATERGIVVTKLNLLGRRSWPDRCFWLPGGRPLLIEFKKPGEEPTELQADTIAKLRRLGYDVAIHENTDEAIEEIQAALAARRVAANLAATVGTKVAPRARSKVPAGARQRRSVPRPGTR